MIWNIWDRISFYISTYYYDNIVVHNHNNLSTIIVNTLAIGVRYKK